MSLENDPFSNKKTKIDQWEFRLYEAISTVKAQFLHEQQNMVCDSMRNFSKNPQKFPKFWKTENFRKIEIFVKNDRNFRILKLITFKRHEICSDETDELKSKIEILEDKVRNYFEKNRKLKADNENAEINEGNILNRITWPTQTHVEIKGERFITKIRNLWRPNGLI